MVPPAVMCFSTLTPRACKWIIIIDVQSELAEDAIEEVPIMESVVRDASAHAHQGCRRVG